MRNDSASGIYGGDFQYREALLSDALSYYDVNLTKDEIQSEVIYKDIQGKIHSTLDLLNLPSDCSFSEFIDTWGKQMISPENYEKYDFLKDVRNKLIELYSDGKKEYQVNYWFTSNGRDIYMNQSFLLTKNREGDICALAVSKDYTKSKVIEERAHRRQLEQYAYFDPVTTGYNYIKFKSKLIEQNISGSIISFDIHSFKIINSICGINKGDDVIKQIWATIIDVLDFDSGDLAGHINADHFIIFVPGFDTKTIVQKLKNLSLAMNIISAALTVPQLVPYFGISKWQPGKRIELAYSESVAAKRDAKDFKDRNYAFYEEVDTEKLIEEKRTLDNFEDALARKEFKIWYQPKYNPVNHQLVGAEALVRWEKDDGSMVSPGMFIPLFEQKGLIRQFDEYVFRNVCMQQYEWKKEGKTIIPISINLSRVSLYYKDIVTEYNRIVDEYNLEKNFLPIEITESAAANNSEIQSTIDELYSNGFKLHMDDFGAGYSSLASLNTMRFDTLKIDKSLIDYIGAYGGERLLEHIILLCKQLGMKVTAEGVECSKQVTFLKHIGCDSIQGYFYSKPLPKDNFEPLLFGANNSAEKQTYDYLSEHISEFKNSMLKAPLYAFVINLTKNTYVEAAESSDFKGETHIKTEIYDKVVKNLAENFIMPEFKNAYLDFMNREKLIESYPGIPITKMIEYNRNFEGAIKKCRLIVHIFKVQDSDDLWMYETVSIL